MDGEPPGEVWYIEFRWANTEASGRDGRYFGTQAEAEDFLHFCYVSQYKPGDVLAPTAIWLLNRPEGWVLYSYTVKSFLAIDQTVAPTYGADDVAAKERSFATITDAPPAAVTPVDPPPDLPPGVIPPASYLPPKPEGD